MAKIVSYKKDALGPRCHMKLESGERILIHSEAATSPSATEPLWLTVTTLKLGGLVPGDAVYRVDQRNAAVKERIARLPAIAEKPATLDAVIELLRDAASVAEVRKRLTDALGEPAGA